MDEKTNLQHRTRKAPTRPPEPEPPIRVENEYQRNGALHLFAALDTRTGKVYHSTGERKRQIEFLQLLQILDQEFDPSRTPTHPCGTCCRRLAQYRFMRAETSRRSSLPIDFRPRRFSATALLEPWFRCSSSSSAMARSILCFSACSC